MDDKTVFEFYKNSLMPIIGDLEIIVRSRSEQISFEIEASFSHLAVASTTDDKTVHEDNLSKALSHLQRAALDASKMLYEHFADEVDKLLSDNLIRDYCINLSEGDVGNRLQNAKAQATEARRLEIDSVGINPTCSIDKYYETAKEYQSILKLVDHTKIHKIKKHHNDLEKTTSWRIFLRSNITNFIFGLMTGLSANWVFAELTSRMATPPKAEVIEKTLPQTPVKQRTSTP